MNSDRLIRATLWATAAFNIGGSNAFAFPGWHFGQMNDFPPDVPPMYRFMLALLIFGYGCAYAWLARQETISRPFIAFCAANKSGVFAIVFILWLANEASLKNVLALSGDLLFAALFVIWLARTRAGRAR